MHAGGRHSPRLDLDKGYQNASACQKQSVTIHRRKRQNALMRDYNINVIGD